MKQRIPFVVLLSLFFLSAAGLGQGRGGGGGGGGQGGACSPEAYTGMYSQAVDFDGSNLKIGNTDIGPIMDDLGPLRLANEVTAVKRPDGSYLVAASMTTSPSVSTQEHRLTILTFEPGVPLDTSTWTLLGIIDVQSLDLDGSETTFFTLNARSLVLADLDSDGSVDDLLAGGPHAVLFFDVDSTNPLQSIEYQVLQSEPGSEGFAASLAFGDVNDGDSSPEIVVGANVSEQVFIYDIDCSGGNCNFSLQLTLSEPGTRFGTSVAVNSAGGLYVGAPWAKVGKKNEAGKVFYYPDITDIGTYSELQRANPQRSEELGDTIVLVDFGSGSGEQLVAASESSGGSMAVFPTSPAVGTVNEDDDLDTTPDYGLVQSLSAAEGVVVLGAPNACQVSGAVYRYDTGSSEPEIPEILWSPFPGSPHAFGWGSFAVGDYIFITERGRDQNGDGLDEGQIYVYPLS